MATLTINKKSPNIGALLAAEYVKGSATITVKQGDVNLLQPNKETSFTTTSTICRYFARLAPALNLYGQSPLERTEVDHWLEFSARLGCSTEFSAAVSYLNQVLEPCTYLVGHAVTIADMAVWGALRGSGDWQGLLAGGQAPANVERYYTFLAAQPAFQNAAKSAPAAAATAAPSQQTKQAENVKKERKEEGKFIELPGAEMGKVVVRFPPEASGYLHVGHAKAALLNQYYQVAFKGKLIMRFDDTNPAKESSEFEQVILEDIKRLGLEPDQFTHTSDHFELLLKYCEQMIRDGMAYVDDTDGETMKAEREQRVESKNRNNDVEKNLAMWEEMKAATDHGKMCAVRAKMDMKSDNGCMRDPTIYRCKAEEHVRAGFTYKVYPTYDFACPIVDSIEGVTHALRTTEYLDRDDQYYWFIDALGLRKPYIWSYSRLNLQNTVMSKRKLAWCVAESVVDGWDDPRFPTVRGVLRRGMTVEGLKQFVIAQGSSRSVVMMDWDKIWAFNKKVIDPAVPRYTALLRDDVVVVKVNGATEEVKDAQKHPKDESIGMKKVWFGPEVYIEGADAETLQVGETVTFINWGNLRIKKIIKDADDKVSSVEADLDLANKDYKKTLKLTWLTKTAKAPFIPAVCVHFENIITKAVLAKEDDFKSFINRDSKAEHVMLGDPELANLKKGDMIQLQRRGYYICDSPYEPASRYTGRESPVMLFYVPDGHTKEMPKAGSKHKEPTESKGASAKEKAQNKKGKAAEKSPQDEQPPTPVSAGKRDAAAINQDITAQGDEIRQLKAEKAAKTAIDPEVKKLLALKAEFKTATGLDWKPGMAIPAAQPAAPAAATPPASGDAAAINAKIVEQGDKIRKLKGEKAAKNVIEPEVKTLLALKADFKSATGIDWKPGVAIPAAAPAPASAPSGGSGDAATINQKIVDQGDKIRKLKGEKAGKGAIDPEVKILLALKADFKTATGQDWKPGMVVPEAAAATAAAPPAAASHDAASINQKIIEQGDKIRKLKSEKANKATIEPEVKVLLSLKADYKAATGQDWKPGCVVSAPVQTTKQPSPEPTSKMADNTDAKELKAKIDAQGNKVRELKSGGGDKASVDDAVKALLDLKLQYKEMTGEDLAGGARGKKGKGGDKNQPANKGGKQEQNKKEAAKDEGAREVKKVTRLGLEARKEDNLPDWYSQVITKAEMIEYYDVSGCYVLRPWAFGIWEAISAWFDAKIKEIGFQNCYFPIFVSNAALQKEKEHIEDFAPEVAWVTRSGDTVLAEPIAVRPTSETVMYPAYAKWVQSHRDLPIKLNQWCNVVRWEFKHPQPFLRTREFLWQEGHSAYATYEEAEHEVHHIINLYEEIYETQLAIPVVKGKKTQKEKFAGGDFTTTVEAYISATGRGIQAATSHHLGQNFSKMFDISFEHPETKERCYAYQNSWAITTRSIGVIVMVHGDNKGLILPPKIALYQAVIVPCGITTSLSDSEKAAIIAKCEELEKLLSASKIRVKGDFRDNYSPGWKFNHWELKGVPLRIELGQRDMKANQFVAVRRDTGDKVTLSLDGAAKSVQDLLVTVQQAMFDKAKKELDENLVTCYDMTKFCESLNEKKIIFSPFCGDIPCEENIKKVSAQDAIVEEGAPAMGAKGLCIPFKQPGEITSDMKCICPGCPNKPKYFTLFGRSY